MYEYKAKLVKVIDGDTIDLNVDLGFYIFIQMRFRMAGINTPERGKPGWNEAKQFVIQWFSEHDGECTVKILKPLQNKYERYLAYIYTDETYPVGTLNRLLINANLATECMK